MTKLPQVARNVRVDPTATVSDDMWRDAVAAAETELADRGRVLVRPSGTEPLVRVMVEAPTQAQAGEIADRIAGRIAALAEGSPGEHG